MYTTINAESCKRIAEQSKAVVVVVENQLQRDKVLKVAQELPQLKAIIQYSDVVSQDIQNQQGICVYTWKKFKHLGDVCISFVHFGLLYMVSKRKKFIVLQILIPISRVLNKT
jgi:long-subunit acyl-CoA synthetase (AMP-forming)